MISQWITVYLMLATQLFPCRAAEVPYARITRSKNGAQSLCSLEQSGEDEYGDVPVVGLVTLRSTGYASSVELQADAGYRYPFRKSVCSTIVKAAPSHMLSLSLFPTESASAFERRERSATDRKESCPLRVLLEKDVGLRRDSLFSVDLCDAEDVASNLHFVEALPHTVILEWTPPKSASSMAVPTSIAVTSVGKGERECSSSRNMVPCFKRSRKPILCVAKELVCNGRRNCPMEGDDEDPSLCNAHGGEIANGQGLPIQQDDTVANGAKTFLENLEILFKAANASTKQSTDKPTSHIRPDGEAPTLAKYGTWGYLLLAMLSCGGLLTMCGMWECCCRQSKANPPSPPHHSPTTVLIINQEQQAVHTTPLSPEEHRRNSTPEPPAYEELDQPPAYGSLFPGFIKIEDVEEHSGGQNINNSTAESLSQSAASPAPSPTPQRISGASSSIIRTAVSRS